MQLARSASIPRLGARVSPWRLVDRRDRIALALLGAYASLLVLAPGGLVVALGVWWCANTVSHRFVHRPMFEGRGLDRALSFLLSSVMGFPQRLWRQRHLAHHAEVPWKLRLEPWLLAETALVTAQWAAIALLLPVSLAASIGLGFLAAQALCWMQGFFEHRGGTTSCHAAWWNLLFLNDGYHAAHHAQPRRHFAELPMIVVEGERVSRWPPVLRWLEVFSLDGLERVVVRRPWLQRLVLRAHRRALRTVVAGIPSPQRVTIIGGGLFPRSAILARELWPGARIEVLDCSADHLQLASKFPLDGVTFRQAHFSPGERLDADLVFVPLALLGARDAVYASPPAAVTLVHDWIGSRRVGSSSTRSVVVAWWLLKRIHVVVSTANPGLTA
ncbi:MAG: fatty acid desaturase [Planctomycetota bacterium]